MHQQHPFRFGVAAESAPSRDQWIALVRKTEELGYATFLLADHYVNEFPPIAALMSADATTTLRVGTFVFDNDFRHPALLAKEIATLDLLSGGRFEMGIGAGWHQPEYQQAGIAFDPAGVRISRMEEALRIIRSFFTEETVTFAGNHYTITDLKASPKPLQRPHPPIFIGGGGKRLLTIAGREYFHRNLILLDVSNIFDDTKAYRYQHYNDKIPASSIIVRATLTGRILGATVHYEHTFK